MNLPDSDSWHYEFITPDLIQGERVNKVIYSGQTEYQSVVIQDTSRFGRSLVLDNKTQSTEADEFVYHESLVQPVMMSQSAPKNVFVAGGGEGATAREILRHRSVEQVVMVDIDSKVVDLCNKYLPSFHKGSFSDARLKIFYEDAWDFLYKTDEIFDVVVIDIPDPLEFGPAYRLYTVEFYDLVMKCLGEKGIMVVQAGPTGPSFYEQCFSAVFNTVSKVFSSVTAYQAFVSSFGSTWGFVVGSLGPNPAELDENRVDHEIYSRKLDGLSHYDGQTHSGMFKLPKYLRTAINLEDRIITTENPLFVK